MRRLPCLAISSVLLGLCAGGVFAGQHDSLGGVPIVVSPEALPGMLDGPPRLSGLVLLDGRSLSDFQAGHVAGAVWANMPEWKAASLNADALASSKPWEYRLRGLGIRGDSHVIVYDDGNMSDAARLWFLLQLLGVKSVGVLNGGFPELGPLIESGRVRVVTDRFAPDSRRVDSGFAAASECRVRPADKATVRRLLGSPSAVILDVRSEAEFAGTDTEKNPRHGHLPNAVNLPHYRLLNTKDNPATVKSKGPLKSPAELRRLFEQAGLTGRQTVITHCQSGGRASLAALALIYAGYGQVANYYPSFADWAADTEAPLVRSETANAAAQ